MLDSNVKLSTLGDIEIAELLVFVAEEMNVYITDSDVEKCKTIGDVLRLAEGGQQNG